MNNLIDVEMLIYEAMKHGMSFLIEDAKKFIQQNGAFKQISESQINSLSKVVTDALTYEKLRKDVDDWLTKQADKKSGQKWAGIKTTLLNALFGQWDVWRDQLITTIQTRGPSQLTLNEIEHFLIHSESNTNSIRREMAIAWFQALITIHRCMKHKSWEEFQPVEEEVII